MQSKKRIIITGSMGTVGSVAASHFKVKGWEVVCLDVADEGPCNGSLYISCDVTDTEKVNETVAYIEENVGRIDAIFTAAGMNIPTGFEDTDMMRWQEALDVWLGGTTNICRAVVPYMLQRKAGKVVILSPDYSNVDGDCVMNAAAAGALHGFGKSFGAEVAPENVTVNVLSASLPFNLDVLCATAYYLADKGDYISAQVVSVTGEQQRNVE